MIIKQNIMTEIKRKGARSTKDIPKDVLAKLNMGAIETANLVEWLAIDQRLLLKNMLIQSNRTKYLKPILAAIDNLKKQTVNTINDSIGKGIFEQAIQHDDQDFLTLISTHTSDAVRCWATYTVGKNPALDTDQILQLIQPFAADTHFGVREICWLAVRPQISKNLKEALSILSQWTSHKDENVRRFASEATRPRGVWCEHIEELKQNPEMGLVILEPLKADPSRYVQDSVGNWLNDASKTKADFVKNLKEKWQIDSPGKATMYILKKALRTIEK